MKPILSLVFLLAVGRFCLAADSPVRIDNEHARVLYVTSAPGAKSAPHEHAMNRVMIYLDPGRMTLAGENGPSEELIFKAGDALWSPARGRHTSENHSEKPVRIIEVELKSTPGSAKSPPPSARDWVKLDPKRYQRLFENDQVRVVRAKYKPHESGVPHEHPWPYVVAFFSEGSLKVTPDGRPAVMSTFSAGQVAAGNPSSHVEENLSDHPLEVLVVEFKK